MTDLTAYTSERRPEAVLVNVADWDGPEVPDGWMIVNAPRPLAGEKTWTGQFRHGVFYAAGPNQMPAGGRDREQAVRIVASWDADDAWPVVFTTNAEIEEHVRVRVAEHGYKSLDEVGLTVAELAVDWCLPWDDSGDK